MALRTFLQVMLADVTAFVADRIRNVEGKVVTSFLSCDTQKLSILCL